MSPDDDLPPLPPTDLPPEEEQRHAQAIPAADYTGVADAAGALVEGVAHIGNAAGEAATAGAEAAAEAAGAAGEALGAVAEGASGCSCSAVVLLFVGLSAGSALAASFLR